MSVVKYSQTQTQRHNINNDHYHNHHYNYDNNAVNTEVIDTLH